MIDKKMSNIIRMKEEKRSNIATFIISVQRHMEMDFGFKGRDYHLDFTSDENDEIFIFEIVDDNKKGFEKSFESIRDLFENCKIEDCSFDYVLYNLDYIYA